MPSFIQYSNTKNIQPENEAASVAMKVGNDKERFASQSGNAIGGAVANRPLGNYLDQQQQLAENQQASQAIGHGAAVYSSLYSDLTDQWNQIAAKSDPNDTSVAQGFKEHILDPSLDKFQQSFEGMPQRAQDWAQNQMISMRQHFFEKTTADMGTRASEAVHQNITDMARNFSNTAASDPTTLSHINDTINTSVQSLIEASPYISADEAARIKAEVVPKMMTTVAQSAFYGMAQANPDAAMQALKKGDFEKYFDKETEIKAEAFARSQKNLQFEDKERARTFQREQEMDAATIQQSQDIADIFAGKQGVVAKAMANPMYARFPQIRENIDSYANATHQKALSRLQEGSAIEALPHPENYRQLILSMHDQYDKNPNNMTDKPYWDALKAKQINIDEFNGLLSRFKSIDNPIEQSFNRQLKVVDDAMAKSINGQILKMQNPEAYAQNIVTLDQGFHATIAEWRKQGKDVTPLITPGNPQYYLSQQRINTLFTSPSDMVAKQADQIKGLHGDQVPAIKPPIQGSPEQKPVTYEGYRFPNQAALDKYLKAKGNK
jgi:hypothetical protein